MARFNEKRLIEEVAQINEYLEDCGANAVFKHEPRNNYQAVDEYNRDGQACRNVGSGTAREVAGYCWDRLRAIQSQQRQRDIERLEREASAAGVPRYTLAELQEMPTVESGHFDNVKSDDGTTRVLLSRMTVADGAPYDNQVTVERLIGGSWRVIDTYPAR